MHSSDTMTWLIRSRHYLAESFRLSPDLRLAAASAGYSTSHYHRLFKSFFGETPWDYVSRLRFEEAKRLLCLSSLTVSDVSLYVGFESLPSFSTAFAERYGFPPTVFRRIFSIPFQGAICFIPHCIYTPQAATFAPEPLREK